MLHMRMTLANNRLSMKFAFGAGASVLCAFGAGWLADTALGVLPVVLTAAAWTALMHQHDRESTRAADARLAHEREVNGALVGNLGAAFKQCAGEFNTQLATS